MEKPKIIINEKVRDLIIVIRGQRVLLDFHLAELYMTDTRVLKQQVRRNMERFPSDFLIRLTKSEWQELITNCDKLGNVRFSPVPPFAFTEQGVAMLSSVLRSPKAIEVNIAIMRTFVILRQMMESNDQLKRKIDQMEQKYDEKFQVVFKAIKSLLEIKSEPRRQIGFRSTKNLE